MLANPLFQFTVLLILLVLSLVTLMYLIVGIKMAWRKRLIDEQSILESEIGMLVTHGMVNRKEGRGVLPDTALSDTFYKTMSE